MSLCVIQEPQEWRSPWSSLSRTSSKFTPIFTGSICHSCQILIKPELPRHTLEKNTQIQDFTQIRAIGAEFSLRIYRQTDRNVKKLLVDFLNFSNAPKILVNSAHRKYLCVLYASQDKQRLLPYST